MNAVEAIFSVAFFMIFISVSQWMATLMGGSGTFEKVVYIIIANIVPNMLIASVFTILGTYLYLLHGFPACLWKSFCLLEAGILLFTT